MKRKISSFVLLFTIILTLTLTVGASTISPRLNNTASTSTNFAISSAGKATISISYEGYRNITTGATITSYIEKRTLGLFWKKVDIGETNNEWVDVSTDYADAFGHVVYLSDTGTYRATVVYEISGTGGTADEIDFEKTVTYS